MGELRLERALTTGLLLPGVFTIGLALFFLPALGAGLALALLAWLFGYSFPAAPPKVFLGGLAFLLVGYAFIGREFAHTGVPPIYIGELVLAIGLVSWALCTSRWAALRSPLGWLILAFAVWGCIRTVPYWSMYGVDVLRDAVVWGYGLTALLVVPFLLPRGRLEAFPRYFASVIPWFLLWAPVGLILSYSNTIHFWIKPGDMGVHLGGAGAFLLLGLHQYYSGRSKVSLQSVEWFWWLTWLFAVLVVGSLNRGGFLASAVAMGIVFLLRPAASARKLFILCSVVTAFALGLLVADFSIDVGTSRHHRTISPSQIVSNIASISGETEVSGGSLEQNRSWRLDWWGEIVNYTVFGDYFWTGKGFGINLADEDGFQVTRANSLRSPHNGHLTVLARAGVPGIALWIFLQLGFAVLMVRAFLRAQREGREWSAKLYVWILAYWAAFMVNASFDVYLEGPQGGIWFWTLVGLGIAAMLVQNETQCTTGPATGQQRSLTGTIAP